MLGHGYEVARVFRMVAGALILKIMRLLWLLGHGYEVARVFWMVAGALIL